MLKKSLAAALGAMLMAGTAGAVEVAQGGKGDLLIAPVFMTGGGWTSEIKVINTNTVDSAVAKVVFHGPVRSEEVLDFLIFLSPGDVWTGVVQQNADGTVGVSSADPSAMLTPNLSNGCPSTSGATSGLNPAEARFTTPHAVGYATVTESRMVRGLGAAPVAKSAVLAAYSSLCAADTTITTADTDNVLTGSVTLVNPQNGNKLSLPLTALANYDNQTYLKVGDLTAFAGAGKVSTKAQVEDALWASDFAVPFNNTTGNMTFATVTFPTKETYNLSQGTQYTPFPNAVPVSYAVRNEEEEVLGTVGCRVSPCALNPGNSLPNELNIVALAAGGSIAASTASQVNTERFTKGWVNMAIAPEPSDTRSNVNYNNFNQVGAPALVTYIHWDYTLGSLQGTWQYAAKTYAPAAR